MLVCVFIFLANVALASACVLQVAERPLHFWALRDDCSHQRQAAATQYKHKQGFAAVAPLASPLVAEHHYFGVSVKQRRTGDDDHDHATSI